MGGKCTAFKQKDGLSSLLSPTKENKKLNTPPKKKHKGKTEPSFKMDYSQPFFIDTGFP